jgi:uncharacterized protein YqgV (UPF0045/DUF77 family)
MMLPKATLMAAALLAAGLAHAQAAPSAAKKELVAKVVQLTQPAVEAMSRTLTEQPAMQTMQQAGPMLQRMPAERRDALARDVEADVRKYIEETTPIVRDRAIKLAPTTIGTLLDERMTEDELRQVIAILESPANKKFQSLFPDMQKVLGEKLVADTKDQVEIKVRAMQNTIAARLGVTPNGGAASGAKPAAQPKK